MASEAIAFAEATTQLPPRYDRASRELDDLRLGIVGAGKLGTTIARAAIAAGYDVAMSGSGPADDIALTVEVLAPGARAVTTDEVVRHADLIILAVPTHRFRELPSDLFNGKILVDAMNYWEPVDGTDPELAATADGTSTVVQQHFLSARLVKSLNQLGYHELDEHRHPRGAPDRVAIGSAGDNRAAVAAVMRLIDRLGFDAVDAGPLENGLALEPDGSPFAVTYNADELASLLARSHGARLPNNPSPGSPHRLMADRDRAPAHEKSDDDDDLASRPPFMDVPDGRRGLAQRVGPVDRRGD